MGRDSTGLCMVKRTALRKLWKIPWTLLDVLYLVIMMNNVNGYNWDYNSDCFGCFTMVNGCTTFHRTPVRYEALQEQNYWLTNLVMQHVYCGNNNVFYYPVTQEIDSNVLNKRRKTSESNDRKTVKQVVNLGKWNNVNESGNTSDFCFSNFNNEESIQMNEVEEETFHQNEQWTKPTKTCKAKSNEPKVDPSSNHYEILSEPDDDIPDIVTVELIPENELNDAGDCKDRLKNENLKDVEVPNEVNIVTMHDVFSESVENENKPLCQICKKSDEQKAEVVQNCSNEEFDSLVKRMNEHNVNKHEMNVCTQRWSYISRLTQSHKIVTEALNASKVVVHRRTLKQKQEEIEIMRLEVLYSENIDRFHDIVLKFEEFNINLGHIFDAVRNEEKKELKSGDNIQHNKDSTKLKRKADDLKGSTNVLREMFLDRVAHTEERLREAIGWSLPDHPQSARKYNVLLNKSKEFTKFLPKQMSQELYDTKALRYEVKIQNAADILYMDDGYLRPIEDYYEQRKIEKQNGSKESVK